MLDTQNQGPQCTACGSPMKLTAIEPGGAGQDLRFLYLPALQNALIYLTKVQIFLR